MVKFEGTGFANVHSGRGWKPDSAEAVEKVVLQVEEDKASNEQLSTNVRRMADALDLPCSTVQKFMGISSGIIRTSFNLGRSCLHLISRLDIGSHFSNLVALWLMHKDLGISWVKNTFIRRVWRILTINEFGNLEISI